MQMSLFDFEEITLKEFINKLIGFYEYQSENQKNEWLRTQYLSYSILINNPYIKPKDKPKTFDDFVNGKSKKPQSESEKLEAFKKFQQLVKTHKNEHTRSPGN